MSLTVKNDSQKVFEGIREGLQPIINDLLVGAANDLTVYGNTISAQLAVAAASNRKDLVEELKGQLRLLAETNRLRVVAAKDRAFQETMGKVLDLTFSAVSKALLSITVV